MALFAILFIAFVTLLLMWRLGKLSPGADYAYRRALQIAPGYPGALYFYAVALAENDRAKEARPYFERLVETIPVEAPFRKSLIEDLDRAGLLPRKTAP